MRSAPKSCIVRRMRKLLAPAFALLMAPLVTCGGDDGGSCPGFTPCGGSPVGTWSVQQYCVSGGESFIDDCPDAKLSPSGLKAAGTVTYNANMTYTQNLTFSGSAVMTLPNACLDGLSCAQAQQAFSAVLTNDPDSPFASVTCAGSKDCTCTLNFRPTPSMQSGRWTVNGNTLTELETGAPATESVSNEFCVATNTMNLRSPMSMGMMGAEATEQIVLKKQ
jgi:hypothetical protein